MSSSNFTSDDDICGSTLLNLVCRGHVLIANILEASTQIPPCFRSATTPTNSTAATAKKEQHDENELGGTKFTLRSPWSIFRGSSSTTDNPDGVAARRKDHSMYDGSTIYQDNDGLKFKPILFDFTYLANPEQFDSQAQPIVSGGSNSARNYANHNAREQLEQEFQSTYQSTLIQFHELFIEIYNYYLAIHQFSTDLLEGRFLHYTVESIFLDSQEGKQLLCELFYVYGSAMMMLDLYIPGDVRERLIIAHYRYCGTKNNHSFSVSNFEDLCKLFHRTHTSTSHSIQQHSSSKSGAQKGEMDDVPIQPLIQEELLTRLPIPSTLIQNIIESLISDELYTKSAQAFPNYQHRTTKLARQASMLFVILFFDPTTLKSDTVRMRQVVDKFFPSNWILPLYNGVVIDLSIEWGTSRFSAARAALKSVIQPLNMKQMYYKNAKLIQECTIEIKSYLTQNIITDIFVLDHESELLDCMRKANAALKWQILHRVPDNNNSEYRAFHQNTKLASAGGGGVDANDLITLLLMTSQFEVEMRRVFGHLLRSREQIWMDCKNGGADKMKQLSNFFAGKDNLKKVDRNEGLMKWFSGMADEIESLSYEEHKTTSTSTSTGRKIQLCVQALDEVEQFDLIDRNDQVKNILSETKTDLFHMVKIVSIKRDVCSTIDTISDCSYGREVLEHYLSTLHDRAIKDPKSLGLLRPFFLKMTSFLAMPTYRLKQQQLTGSSNLRYLTEFYANTLLSFITKILDVIPISIFSTLARIMEIKEKSLVSLPPKIDVDSLKNYAQSDDRYKLAKITHELSILAEGIFRMEATLIGHVEIHPRTLLEEGLRKELVRQISSAFHYSLQFELREVSTDTETFMSNQKAFIESITTLANRMKGFRRAIEYIQDFLEIQGLQIFLEEITRVIEFNLEQEAQRYVKIKHSKTKQSQLSASGSTIPIPQYPRSEKDPFSFNFIGRTLNALIRLIDSKYTIYSRHSNGWLLLESGDEVCDIAMISLLKRAIGIQGLVALDTIISHKIAHELRRFFKFYSTAVPYALLEKIRDSFFPEWDVPKNGTTLYNAAVRKTGKLMSPLIVCFTRVGQMQLLRKMIRTELDLSSRLDADKLKGSSTYLNLVMMRHLLDHGMSDNTRKHHHHHNVFSDVANMLRRTGGGDPMATIFIKANTTEGLPVLLLLFIITHIQPKRVTYDSDIGSLVGSKQEEEPFDGWAIVSGIATLLRQFHASYAKSVIALLCQYLRCSLLEEINRGGTTTTTTLLSSNPDTKNNSQKKNNNKKNNNFTKKDSDAADNQNQSLSNITTEQKHLIIFMNQLCISGNIPTSVISEYLPQHILDILAL